MEDYLKFVLMKNICFGASVKNPFGFIFWIFLLYVFNA